MISGAPPLLGLSIPGPVGELSEVFPNPMDPAGVEWRLRDGRLRAGDLKYAAWVMDAYRQLLLMSDHRREVVVRGVRILLEVLDRPPLTPEPWFS